MTDQPKPRPLPRRPTAGPMFTIVRCASCDWMGAGYGVSNCYAVWEEHADVDGCSTFKADVQSQPEWMVPW